MTLQWSPESIHDLIALRVLQLCRRPRFGEAGIAAL